MKNPTLYDFLDLLGEMGLVARKLKVGDAEALLIPLSADNDFDRDVPLLFCVNEGKVLTSASISGYGKELGCKKMLEFCNNWNSAHISPCSALSSDGDFRVMSVHYLDEDVSKEYVKENVIALSISQTWKFFVTLKKQLEGQNPFED